MEGLVCHLNPEFRRILSDLASDFGEWLEDNKVAKRGGRTNERAKLDRSDYDNRIVPKSDVATNRLLRAVSTDN